MENTDEKERIIVLLKEYRLKSLTTTADELQEEMDDSEDMELVFCRKILAKGRLNPEQRIVLAESDRRIAEKMRPETLEDYADQYPDLPIREWWARKSGR